MEYLLGRLPFQTSIGECQPPSPTHRKEGERRDYLLFFFDAASGTLLSIPIELESGETEP